eukprot:6180971-Pleurochrysis_carterae.AAC.4
MYSSLAKQEGHLIDSVARQRVMVAGSALRVAGFEPSWRQRLPWAARATPGRRGRFRLLAPSTLRKALLERAASVPLRPQLLLQLLHLLARRRSLRFALQKRIDAHRAAATGTGSRKGWITFSGSLRTNRQPELAKTR